MDFPKHCDDFTMYEWFYDGYPQAGVESVFFSTAKAAEKFQEAQGKGSVIPQVVIGSCAVCEAGL